MTGIIPINKPETYTSFDVVAKIRKKFKIKRVGHTGTLDPMATGVLLICLGEATKVASFIQNGKKKYRAQIKLGQVTDTDDITGNVLETKSVPKKISIDKIIKKFVGNIDQVPPSYSAISHKGKRLYKYAREGTLLKLEPRKVIIYNIKLNKYNNEVLNVDIECSKGTYIRSLARDIGAKIGCGGTLYSLERLETGGIDLSESFSLDEVLEWDEKKLHSNIKKIEYFFKDLYDVPLELNELKYIKNGFLGYKNWDNIISQTISTVETGQKPVSRDTRSLNLEMFKFTFKDKIMALAKVVDNKIKFIRVFNNEDN